jgi:Protein of unknown function (DUF3307)
MHLFATCFLALYLAHLLTDFVFQSDRLVARREEGSRLAYAEHGGIYLLSSIVLMWLALPGLAFRFNFYVLIVGLTLAHLGIDWGKSRLVQSKVISGGARAFLGDQLMHGLTVCTTSWLLARPSFASLISTVRTFQSNTEMPLLLLVVYIGVIFGGGYIVRFLTKALGQNVPRIAGETTDELQNAGMYIGWLERFLVLTALVLHSPATVGLIFAAKSIARYSELKSVRFAEYFLIGTLLSVSIGILGGLILLKAFYGSVALAR